MWESFVGYWFLACWFLIVPQIVRVTLYYSIPALFPSAMLLNNIVLPDNISNTFDVLQKEFFLNPEGSFSKLR